MTTPGRAPIVVGIASGPTHHPALAWGADEAARRGVPLRLVHALATPDDGRGAAAHTLRDAVGFALARHPRLEVSTVLAAGDPVRLLRDQARTAAAVAIGSASLALPVMARTHCPVVVVGDAPGAGGRRPYFVVGVDVGVDGSRHSVAAVDHAFEAAARHGARLRVVYVWHTPLLGVLDERAALREGRRLLAETVEARRVAHPEVDARHEVVRGRPARVLAQESAHALGLVVGIRGHGGVTGLLLGSVVRGVLRRARCPVVAVPRPGEPGLRNGRVPRVRAPRRARGAAARWTRLLTRAHRNGVTRLRGAARRARPRALWYR
ncbi:universal stress protein [Streptomyces cylindrosporus]|uniref:universal stress protein n=1 Tax=Streptomyces cylindrosporus TaxID=2927583 RepID=UPI0027E3411C|nr:universal stress protein [Streptomyces cylindrosporus]